jgi:hypothetical protein
MELREIYFQAKNSSIERKIINLFFAFYLMFFFYWGREEGYREIPTKVLTPIFALIALLMGSGKYILSSEPIKRYLYFLFVAAFSYFWASFTTPFLRQLQMMSGIVAIALILHHFIIKYNTAATGFVILILGSILLLRKGFEISSVTLVSALSDLNADNTLKSLETNENTLACLYLIGMCSIYAFNSIVNNRYLNTIGYLGVFALLYGISLTASRSTLTAGVLLIVLNFATTKSIKLWLKILIIFVFVIYAFSLLQNILFATGAGEKLLNTGDSSSDQVRMIMIGESWEMFVNNPLLGVGLGNVVALSTFKLFTHNDILEVAATLGVAGITFYSYFLFKYYLTLRKLKELNRILYLTFLNNFIIYLFMGLFSVWFTDSFFFILLFMQIAESKRQVLLYAKINLHSRNKISGLSNNANWKNK